MSELIIEGVPLTKEWLANVVEKKLGVRPKIGTSGILDNSELGYMSMIRKVELHFDAEQEESQQNLPKHVVLKIACSAKGSGVIENAGGEVDSKNSAAVEQFMHNTECNYYRIFGKLTDKPLKVPTIYSASKAGDEDAPVPVIVMEMFEDCKVYDLIEGFNEQQLYKIVDQLIMLHIFSLTTEDWKEIKPDAIMLEMGAVFQTMVKNIADNLAKQPGLEAIATYVKNTFEKDARFIEKLGEEYLEEKRVSVLTHGDLWAPQILWDKEDNIAGIIDWQITHRGSPMEDLHHVLSTCTSVENRKKLTEPLLDYYFDKLSAGLEAKGVKMPWTREDIEVGLLFGTSLLKLRLQEEFKHNYIHGAALTIFANGFWSNSPVLQTDGKPDLGRIAESFARCKSYIEETVQVHNMS
ncbi:Protein CBG05337 [Caenorhabditis briggsae]|uniref:Protein CBG05337 n=1 Tax=Caenorhabditis briggsae TaxID=6238 RepID=A8WZM2_CAEBR|nr:Protein CBG05337 [Caenorhabditis briggsae]CAP25832.2 Protein CBG05337 [Caenorhabditis briggsae]